MSNLLKALGFWIWGLIAIGISASLVSVSYRLVSVYRFPHAYEAPVDSSTPRIKNPATLPADAPRVSRLIADEIAAAQNAIQSGQWSEALGNLQIAETKHPLTILDRETIYEFEGLCYVRLRDFKAAQFAYETALATQGYSSEELPRIYHPLFQLAATNGQSAQAIDYGTLLVEVSSAGPNDLLIMSQLYYRQQDCKNSVIWANKSLVAYKAAGTVPKEVLYQIKLQCASDSSDSPAMLDALVDLVRLTNKTVYWNNLLRLERQDERDDHNTLMIYRVMFDTHSMNADTDYIEMAQLLADAGLAGEAQTVLEKAVSSALVKEDHRERVSRLLSDMKSRAVGDESRAAQLDETYVYLGRSLLAQGNAADAKEAFARLKTLPNVSPRVSRLWTLYADMIHD